MKAKKKFGQNFLIDSHYVAKIIKEINPKESDNILEIGPGLGAITNPILKKVRHISVVEIDPDMVKILN
ncbi:MAG: 16S rRNA (adenine(1518)-N(6)/adenine(1519)-N(6))-dimethyltransferase, partial [Nitrosomonadales bacterium]|nr:16S rRNA (adenine(1518)-N(6)/adenine(1519)-N(6))-dimethyltransferase [Nitrosomonadales bacterium]